MTVTSNDTGLTLGVLLEEPLCRNIRADPPLDQTAPVRWCVPLDEALETDELSGLVVFVGPRDQPLTRQLIERLATGGVTAVLVREDVAPETADLLSHWKRQRPTFLIADRGLRYGQVNWLVAQKVLTQRAHALEYGVTVHERLAELLYHGAGLAAMAQQLSRLSGCSVILLDTHFETLAYESVTTMPVPDPAEVTRLLCEVIAQGGLPPANGVRGKAVTIDVQLEDGPVGCIVCPIVLGGTTYGWLLLVELTASTGRHALAQHLVSAEQSATVIGSEMLRLRSVAEAEERARGDFLHALLHDRFGDSHELMARSEHHHFDINATFGVVVATGVFDVSSPAGIEQQWNLARSFRSSGGPSSPWMMATAVGGLLVIVRQLASAGTGGHHRAEEELALFAVDLYRDLGKRAGPRLRVSYGRPGVGASSVTTSYRNARVSLAVAEHVGLAPVCGYAELRVFATLAGLASTPEGGEFANEVLAPLRKASSADDIEKVVMAYIQQGGNLIAAARALQMHRNTVLYKLNRAATLLNMDLRVAENRFTLWLAHRLDLLGRVQNTIGQELELP